MWDCGILGGAGLKKYHIFVHRNKKNTTIGQPTNHHKSKVWYLPFMSFLETEQSTPLAATAAADALLGLHHLAWLGYLAKLALLLGSRQRHGQTLTCWLGLNARGPGQRWGGGGGSTCFVSLALGLGSGR